MSKVAVVYGTRPEAIKMAPVVSALRQIGIDPFVVVTGQHREMLDQINALFGIVPDVDLDLGRPGQTLPDIVSRALPALDEAIGHSDAEAVVVQGDTSTTFVGGLAAFYRQLPVVHVEAGLRTGKMYSPFPEEINRRLTTHLASLHLAPTVTNRENLLAEGVDPSSVRVTGNTVIDAFFEVSSRRLPYADPRLEATSRSRQPVVVVTTHRRESWGSPMRASMSAVRRLAQHHTDHTFIVPMHRNPVVREAIIPTLQDLSNVILVEPLDYGEFARLLAESRLILTDSGGVQEEAPGLGKPVLVLRDDTERPEAVLAGTVRLVGTDPETIYREADRLLTDKAAYAAMAQRANPYGDGHAGERSAAAIGHLLGLRDAPPDFVPDDH